MTQDAWKLAALFAAGAIGCTSSPKYTPPTKPLTPYTAKPATTPAPTGNNTTVTPSRTPTVNGTASGPAPVIMTPVTKPAVTPTQPVLPAAPPSPPSPPEGGGAVMPPIATPVIPPPTVP